MLDRWRFKRRIMRDPLPEVWLEWIAASVVQWRYLDDDERAQLLDDVRSLIADKYWEAANGFALTDEIKVSIAAQAALLVLGLDDDDPFRNVGAIIVHPTTVTLIGERADRIRGVVTDAPQPVLGLTQHNGPVLIAWDEAQENARHPERGHNVVYHEFAHKLDMLDGVVDGTPPLGSAAALERWAEVCRAEFQALRDRAEPDPLLDDYAATNVGEFFAVVTEVFFDRPGALEHAKPELYAVLRDFYRQDPAARIRRAYPEDHRLDD